MSDKRRELADAVEGIGESGRSSGRNTDYQPVPRSISENLPKLEAWLREYLLLSIVDYGPGRGWEVTWKGIEICVKARANDEQTARTLDALAAYRELREKGHEGQAADERRA